MNLANTDIPFEEYRLSRETIDALKYRLLASERCLRVYEMLEKPNPCDEHWVYLLKIAGKLYILIAVTEIMEYGWSPLLRMLEVSGDGFRRLSDDEIIQFLSELYGLNPDKPLSNEPLPICGSKEKLIECFEEEIEDIVKKRRSEKAVKEDPPLHHYEAYENQHKSRHDDFCAYLKTTEEEKVEIKRIMRIVMKKVYNIDYEEEVK